MLTMTRARKNAALVISTIMLLAACSAVEMHAADPKAAVPDCSREAVFQTDRNTIWSLSDQSAIFFEAGMAIDADGSPYAYHPDDVGLDELANAGGPGEWWGVVTNTGRPDGDPLVQGPVDLAPGYYVSRTALEDRAHPPSSPLRYVNAEAVPYLVLPSDFLPQRKARLGDFAVVLNRRNGRRSAAIFADVGPPGKLGEGSIALARALGIRSSPRNGGTKGDVLYLVFSGSNRERILDAEAIQLRAQQVFDAWGGMERIDRCLGEER